MHAMTYRRGCLKKGSYLRSFWFFDLSLSGAASVNLRLRNLVRIREEMTRDISYYMDLFCNTGNVPCIIAKDTLVTCAGIRSLFCWTRTSSPMTMLRAYLTNERFDTNVWAIWKNVTRACYSGVNNCGRKQGLKRESLCSFGDHVMRRKCWGLTHRQELYDSSWGLRTSKLLTSVWISQEREHWTRSFCRRSNVTWISWLRCLMRL